MTDGILFNVIHLFLLCSFRSTILFVEVNQLMHANSLDDGVIIIEFWLYLFPP